MLSSRKIAPLCQQGRRFLCGRVPTKSSARALFDRAGQAALPVRAVRTAALSEAAWPASFGMQGAGATGRHARDKSACLHCRRQGRVEGRRAGRSGRSGVGERKTGPRSSGGYSFCSALRMASAFFFPMPGSSMSLASVAAFMSATESKCSHSRRAVSLPMPGSC